MKSAGMLAADSRREASGFDVATLRRDFPILQREVHGKPLIYLDNAATTQKPRPVLEVLTRYYEQFNANIHRGVHTLSQLATEEYERSRRTVQHFLNASKWEEIVFVRGATEGINLVAQSFGSSRIQEGDEVLITAMEHHSNIVPWQLMCERTGALLKVAPMNRDGELLLDKFEESLTSRTRLVGVVHLSNALGTVNPVKQIIEMAHACRVPVLLDGAQSVPHLAVDVQDLDVDFLVFSGHKIYGPTGIGVLYGKEEMLSELPPYQGGGEMISSVTFEKTSYNALPFKFEAGTPNIAGAVGLGAALEYVKQVGIGRISAYEGELMAYAHQVLSEVPGLTFVGKARQKASVVSFLLEGAHPHDVGTILDQEGIAVRTGHHCAQPVMDFFGVPATSRASVAFYNTREELQVLAQGLYRVLDVLGMK